MLIELLGGIKKNKEVVVILVVGFLLATKAFDSVLDRFLPSKVELTRGPAAAPTEYIDARIGDLDKLSEQRHREAMGALSNVSLTLKEQALDIKTLSSRVYDLAAHKKRQVSETNCYENSLLAKAHSRLGIDCL